MLTENKESTSASFMALPGAFKAAIKLLQCQVFFFLEAGRGSNASTRDTFPLDTGLGQSEKNLRGVGFSS